MLIGGLVSADRSRDTYTLVYANSILRLSKINMDSRLRGNDSVGGFSRFACQAAGRYGLPWLTK
jgi:hypothetical protein